MVGIPRQRLKEKRKNEQAREEGCIHKHLKGIMSKLWTATGVSFELLVKALGVHTHTHTNKRTTI